VKLIRYDFIDQLNSLENSVSFYLPFLMVVNSGWNHVRGVYGSLY